MLGFSFEWDYEGLHIIVFPTLNDLGQFFGNNQSIENVKLLVYLNRLIDENYRKDFEVFDEVLFLWVTDFNWFLDDLRMQNLRSGNFKEAKP